MTAQGYTLFDTPIGPCGVAWGRQGLAGLSIAGGQCRRHPRPHGAAIPRHAGVWRRRRASGGRWRPSWHCCGARARTSRLSRWTWMGVPEFHRRVYEATRAIPPGSTLSYGEVAAQIGAPGAARAVGQALGRNPFAIVVPCHRVLAAGGKAGGFSANGGLDHENPASGHRGGEAAKGAAAVRGRRRLRLRSRCGGGPSAAGRQGAGQRSSTSPGRSAWN